MNNQPASTTLRPPPPRAKNVPAIVTLAVPDTLDFILLAAITYLKQRSPVHTLLQAIQRA
eukprot:338145-Chlamydomonas_euryale.AAC.2